MSLIPGAGKCVRFIMGQRVSAVDARRRYPYIPADFPGCWLVSGVAWRGGREAEGAGLLNQYTGNCIVGSNPIPSAILFKFIIYYQCITMNKLYLPHNIPTKLFSRYCIKDLFPQNAIRFIVMKI
jgi:hypothetical protein